MQTTRWAILACLTLALAGGAAGQQRDAEPKSDQEFLTQAITMDTAEIKMGELAQRMATSPDVKRFAQKMVADHTKHRTELTTLAKGLNVTVNEADLGQHKQGVEKLSKADQAGFDREYIRSQVDGHQMALKMYERWAKEAKDEKLRAAAEKTIPVVRMHLDEAQRLWAGGTGTKDAPTRDKDR